MIHQEANRWYRDAAVQKLIDHLNAPDKRGNWDRLTASEYSTIAKEIERCRSDFSYASRNYFWIKNEKDRKNQLFRLWESQELILEKLEWLKARFKKSQRLLIVKARQLGCSSLIEARIAWRAIFFGNVNAIIISEDEKKAAKLFQKPQLIYDNLPWWLKPMTGSREIKGSLLFDNPNHEDKEFRPGLNSTIDANGANKIVSVARGEGINAAHISELALWPEDKARQIIQEELDSALSDSIETFAVIETTAKGAGTYTHELWLRNVRLAEHAEWWPLFLPWFFEKRHVLAPPDGWKVKPPEQDMRERAEKDWVRCGNPKCLQFHERMTLEGVDLEGSQCKTCETGRVAPHILTDEQLYWIEHKRLNREGDEKDLKNLLQERAHTAEVAFQLSGTKVIDEEALAWANKHIMRKPLARGYLDNYGNFHGLNPRYGIDPEARICFSPGCGLDHGGDSNHIAIYEWPKPGAEYVIGGDPSGGLGLDYSAGSVLRVGKMGYQDVQVAIFADNRTVPEDFAAVLNQLGRFYNNALIAVEREKFESCLTWLRIQLQYPNLYIDKNLGNQYTDTTRYGWTTNAKTRPTLWSLTRKWLRQHSLVILDPLTAEELKNFRIEEERTKKTRKTLFPDDRIMATMIAVAVAHQMDVDEAGEFAPARAEITAESAPYRFSCSGCGREWGGIKHDDFERCPYCRVMLISSTTNENVLQSDLEWAESLDKAYDRSPLDFSCM